MTGGRTANGDDVGRKKEKAMAGSFDDGAVMEVMDVEEEVRNVRRSEVMEQMAAKAAAQAPAPSPMAADAAAAAAASPAAHQLARRSSTTSAAFAMEYDGAIAIKTLTLAVIWDCPEVAKQILSALGPRAGSTTAVREALQKALVLERVEMVDLLLGLPNRLVLLPA